MGDLGPISRTIAAVEAAGAAVAMATAMTSDQKRPINALDDLVMMISPGGRAPPPHGFVS